MYYLLLYKSDEGYAERRAPFREEHLAHAKAAAARGELYLGGALADPIDGAVLIFKGNGPEVAKAFAEADPYVRNGVVLSFEVRPWTVMTGCGMKNEE